MMTKCLYHLMRYLRFCKECASKEPDMYVALYADESIPYREIVRVLNIANENHYKMVLATRRPDKE